MSFFLLFDFSQKYSIQYQMEREEGEQKFVYFELDLNRELEHPTGKVIKETAQELFKHIDSEAQGVKELEAIENKQDNLYDKIKKALERKLGKRGLNQKMRYDEEQRIKDLIDKCREQKHFRTKSHLANSVKKQRAYSEKLSQSQNKRLSFKDLENSLLQVPKYEKPKSKASRIQSAIPIKADNNSEFEYTPLMSQVRSIRKHSRNLHSAKTQMTCTTEIPEKEPFKQIDNFTSRMTESKLFSERQEKPRMKKQGVKMKLRLCNGVNQIIDECEATKKELKNISKKINLFDYFCKKQVHRSLKKGTHVKKKQNSNQN